MWLCYVDEAGDAKPLTGGAADTQPVFVLSGILLNTLVLDRLTRDFLNLKATFFPQTIVAAGIRYPLDRMKIEVKGVDLRRDVADGSKRDRRRAIAFVDRVVGLLFRHNAQIISRVYIKGIGTDFDGTKIYTSFMQRLYEAFQNFLMRSNDYGMVIADARMKPENVKVSHAIFTQKYSARGDPYPRIFEVPTFGHAKNSTGLQLADILCSGVLTPLAIHAYCRGWVTNLHVRPGYVHLRKRYALSDIALSYQDQQGKWFSGISVNDGLADQHAWVLWR